MAPAAQIVSDVDPLELALEGVVPSALVALPILALAARAWSRRPAPDGVAGAWGPPLALGLGFFAACVGVNQWPPADAYPDMKARMAWLALAAVVFGSVQAGAQRALRVGVALFYAGAAAWLVAHWYRQDVWDVGQLTLWMAFCTAAAFLAWELCERLALRRPGAGLALTWSLGAGLAAQCFYLAHAESHARMTSGIAVALGMAFLVGLRKPQLSLARGGVLCLVATWSGMALTNHLTAELPRLALVLVVLAPAGAWLGEAAPSQRPRLRLALGLVGVLVPLGLAVWSTMDANDAGDAADAYLESLGY